MLQADGALLGQQGIGAAELDDVLLVVRTFQAVTFVEPGNLNLLCSGRMEASEIKVIDHS